MAACAPLAVSTDWFTTLSPGTLAKWRCHGCSVALPAMPKKRQHGNEDARQVTAATAVRY
jgi:hypothetical protein